MSETAKRPRRRSVRRGGDRRAEIVAAARGWIGTPYQHQASLRGVGADCLGLLRGIWREIVGPEPEALRPYTPGWAEIGGEELLASLAHRHLVPLAPESAFQAGQVVLFRWRPEVPAKHCGILCGPDHFIHAHDGASVAEVALVPGWRRRIAGRFEFPDRRG